MNRKLVALTLAVALLPATQLLAATSLPAGASTSSASAGCHPQSYYWHFVDQLLKPTAR